MDLTEFVEGIAIKMSLLKQKTTIYLDVTDKIRGHVHAWFNNFHNIPHNHEIVAKITIMDERCKDIIRDVMIFQESIDNKIGSRVRSIRALKNKILKRLDSIIKATYASRESFVFNYKLWSSISKFNSSIENFDILIEKIREDLREKADANLQQEKAAATA